MDLKKYTYGNINKISKLLSLLYSILFVFAGLFFLCGLILSFFNMGGVESSYKSTLFWYFIGFGVWSPFFFIYIAHLNVDIEVEECGLRTRFLLKTLFINWGDIEDFKPGKTFGLLYLKQVRVLVTINALTPFHRLYGLIYASTSRPSLLIGTNISNHEELFKIIKNNRKKNVHK